MAEIMGLTQEHVYLFCVVEKEKHHINPSCCKSVFSSFQVTTSKVTGFMRVSLVLGQLLGVHVG